MNTRRAPLLMIVLLWMACAFISCHGENARSFTIATSANMQFAVDELLVDFERQFGIKSDAVVQSSGMLTAQIIAGAPYDVLISADMKYPTEVYEAGMAWDGPKPYAEGSLIAWSMSEEIDLNHLDWENARINQIAIPNPKIAPYGIAAVEYLENKGILNKISSKLVFGQSISQVNQFIATHSVDIGITSKSAISGRQGMSRGQWATLPLTDYSAIRQGVVNIKSNKEEESKQFIDYLFSTEAKLILKKHGFNPDIE